MNELFNKIYDNVICYEEDFIEVSKELDKTVDELLKPHLQRFSNDDMELLKTLMYQISSSSKQTGFQLGSKYALSLLLELTK